MSCGRDQWQQNAHGPNSLNYVTIRSNGQESLRSRAQSSMHVDLKRLPQNETWSKTILVTKAIFVEKDVLQGKRISIKKLEKWLKNFFSFQMSNERNSEKSWVSLKKHKQKKHKRESINIRRRNMERTTAKMHWEKKVTTRRADMKRVDKRDNKLRRK